MRPGKKSALTRAQILKIRRLHRNGQQYNLIALAFGISASYCRFLCLDGEELEKRKAVLNENAKKWQKEHYEPHPR